MSDYDDYEYDCGDYCGGNFTDIWDVVKDMFNAHPRTNFVKEYDARICLLNRFLYFALFVIIIIQIIIAIIPIIMSTVAYIKSRNAEKEIKENFKGLHSKSKY